MHWVSDNIQEITVFADSEQRLVDAEQLAQRLQLPLQAQSCGLQLIYINEVLQLIDHRPDAAGAVFVDFVGGKAAHRRQHGGGRGQTIAKAIGLKGGVTPSVLDCTAGMGRDAFVLASLGCYVTLLERAPVTYALLEDALRRALEDEDVKAIAQRMQLVGKPSLAEASQIIAPALSAHEPSMALSALDYLSSGQNTSDVIYMDPMYPHREKSALVKKEMRIFRELVGDDVDADRLLEAALDAQPARVVVKRPKGAPHLNQQKPSATVESKNTRYDIYPFRKLS